MLRDLSNWWMRKTGQDAVLIVIVLIFFAGMLLPAASRVIDTFHFERHYTDGAIAMRRTNDFLTPRYGDGTVRFRKPLPIYWLLVGSYKLLGVSFFSSRICFLLMGCATIWLAYALALKLTDDIRAARTTAFILLPNLLLIMVSARSIPDILVTFCILVSACGFIQLICFNNTRASSYWSAYGGAALGIAIKGLLPLVFVVYALVFAYFSSSNRQSFRRIFHGGIILVCFFISCSGIFLLVWKHGLPSLQMLWSDQLGEKTAFSGSPLRIGAYYLIYIPFLLPWLFCLAYLFFKQKPEKPLTDIQGKACVFALIWAALLPIIFGLGDLISVRYLLPAIPMLGVAMAIGLCRFSDSKIATIANPLLNVVVVAFCGIATFGLSVFWQTGLLTKYFAGFTVVFLVSVIIALRFQTKQFSSQGVLSVSSFLFLPLFLAIASPITLPDQTAQIAKALRSLNPANRPVFVISTSRLSRLASRLRVSSGDKYPIYEASLTDLLNNKSQPVAAQSIFVLAEDEARGLPPNTLQLQEIAASPSVSLLKLFRATLKGEAKAYFDRRKKHCYAVLPDSI